MNDGKRDDRGGRDRLGARPESLNRIRRRSADALPALRATAVSGASRDRTGDLLLAKQALSQLSYGPWPTESNAGRMLAGWARSR